MKKELLTYKEYVDAHTKQLKEYGFSNKDIKEMKKKKDVGFVYCDRQRAS